MPSIEYENARKATEATVAFGVKITFPAYNGLPQLVKYWGSRDFEVDDETYYAALQSVPLPNEQLGSGQDICVFDVSNAQGALYHELAPYDDVFEDAVITIKECYLTEQFIFESDIIFEGKVESIYLTDQDALLNVSCISDMSAPGFPVGGRILTYRHCGARFNVNGLLDPVFDPCGWQTAQGGNPTYCSHVIKGVDGCEDHNNVHRYYAVPQMADAAPVYIGTDGGGSTGGGLGGGNGTGFEYDVENTCFSERMFVPMIGGNKKSIADVKQNEWIRGFTTLPEDRIKGAEILFVQRHKVLNLYELEFETGEIHETKEEHRYYCGEGAYIAAGHLEEGKSVRFYDLKRERWYYLRLVEKRRAVRSSWVFNIITSTGNYFVQSEKATKLNGENDYICAVSNSKFHHLQTV